MDLKSIFLKFPIFMFMLKGAEKHIETQHIKTVLHRKKERKKRKENRKKIYLSNWLIDDYYLIDDNSQND